MVFFENGVFFCVFRGKAFVFCEFLVRKQEVSMGKDIEEPCNSRGTIHLLVLWECTAPITVPTLKEDYHFGILRGMIV